MTRIVFVLVPGLHLMDLAGPAQVFSSAKDLGYAYDLAYVAETPCVPTAQGITLTSQTDWPALQRDDLVVIPGWRAEEATSVRLWAAAAVQTAAHHESGGTVVSVCAGAFALGQAGLLDGRRCTTHHSLQDELAARHPEAIVVRDVLFVEDQRVVTSAGIASGIDLALHLVATRHGPGAAARVARAMVVYARRNGDEPQSSAMLRHRGHLNDSVHRVQLAPEDTCPRCRARARGHLRTPRDTS
jgi:transcriptional regulator GlxA family with amidase domain